MSEIFGCKRGLAVRIWLRASKGNRLLKEQRAVPKKCTKHSYQQNWLQPSRQIVFSVFLLYLLFIHFSGEGALFEAAELLLLEPEDAAVAELLAGAWQCQASAQLSLSLGAKTWRGLCQGMLGL